jgi:hypothetical protein
LPEARSGSAGVSTSSVQNDWPLAVESEVELTVSVVCPAEA